MTILNVYMLCVTLALIGLPLRLFFLVFYPEKTEKIINKKISTRRGVKT